MKRSCFTFAFVCTCLLTSASWCQEAQHRFTVKDFNWAGAMVVNWKPTRQRDAYNLLEKLRLRVIYRSVLFPAVTIRWNSALTERTLGTLHDSRFFTRIEPAPPISLIVPARLPERQIEPARFDVSRIHQKAIVGITSQQNSSTSSCLPNDPEVGHLWGLRNARVTDAWCCARESSKIVAIIDSGVDYTHPDLQQNIWVNRDEVPGDGLDNDGNLLHDDVIGWDFAESDANPLDTVVVPDGAGGHGTHVAGTVGGVGNNGQGISGINWRVKLMVLRVFNEYGVVPGRATALADAIEYAVKKEADIINLSLRWDINPEMRLSLNTVSDRIDEADRRGVLVVCAAGNLPRQSSPLYRDIDVHPVRPASFQHKNIITVANIDDTERLFQGFAPDGSGASYYGRHSVDLAAPGSRILSTFPMSDGPHKTRWGTSMAAPHVAGAAALIWSHGPYRSYSHDQIKQLILDNARPLPALVGLCQTQGTLDLSFLCRSSYKVPDQQPKKTPISPPTVPQPVIVCRPCPTLVPQPVIVYSPCPPPVAQPVIVYSPCPAPQPVIVCRPCQSLPYFYTPTSGIFPVVPIAPSPICVPPWP